MLTALADAFSDVAPQSVVRAKVVTLIVIIIGLVEWYLALEYLASCTESVTFEVTQLNKLLAVADWNQTQSRFQLNIVVVVSSSSSSSSSSSKLL